MDKWDLFRRKTAADVLAEAQQSEHSLKRTLGAFDITMLGVGAIIGAGIFASFGQAAAGADGLLGAGPALMLSYLLTAVACGFAALCYAEIAAMVPIAGSAYTYSYIAFGEVVAWIIGWDLTIEYAVGNIYVAASWADYLRSFLRGTLGVDFPAWLATDLQTAAKTPEIAAVGAPYRRLRGGVQSAGIPHHGAAHRPSRHRREGERALQHRHGDLQALAGARLRRHRQLFRRPGELDAVCPERLERASGRAPRSRSFRTSGSTRSPRRPRKRASRRRTCRAGSSARSSSARCCTSRPPRC